MIEDLLKNVAQLRSDAQDNRRRARKESDNVKRNPLFNAAAEKFQRAISDLERGLRAVRRQQSDYSTDVCLLLEALSQTYGSLGGTWRDAGNLERARDFYDAGNTYEEQRRQHCNAKDTYNMLQRLVVRVLENPQLVVQADFLADIQAVRVEIERQVNDGRDDSWALADLALARFLCGFDAGEAIIDLERRKADMTFYESAYNAVAALVDEGLGRGLELGDRLESFKRLLQRKGGLR